MINYISFVYIIFMCCSIQSNNFVLISAPGSGKGTFSQYMTRNQGYVQICPGDLFRKEILNQTDLGKAIQPLVESGKYVAEDIVCQMIQKYVEDVVRQKKKFILDGFPRSEHSMLFLLNLFKGLNINNVIFLTFNCSDDVCLKRILGRKVCNNCSAVFHVDYLRDNEINCRYCHYLLSQRVADQENIVKERLSYFHINIEPLLNGLTQSDFSIITIKTEQSLDVLELAYEKLLHV